MAVVDVGHWYNAGWLKFYTRHICGFIPLLWTAHSRDCLSFLAARSEHLLRHILWFRCPLLNLDAILMFSASFDKGTSHTNQHNTEQFQLNSLSHSPLQKESTTRKSRIFDVSQCQKALRLVSSHIQMEGGQWIWWCLWQGTHRRIWIHFECRKVSFTIKRSCRLSEPFCRELSNPFCMISKGSEGQRIGDPEALLWEHRQEPRQLTLYWILLQCNTECNTCNKIILQWW